MSLDAEEFNLYIEWIETLQICGYLPMDMSDEEVLEKIIKMHNADHPFRFDPNLME